MHGRQPTMAEVDECRYCPGRWPRAIWMARGRRWSAAVRATRSPEEAAWLRHAGTLISPWALICTGEATNTVARRRRPRERTVTKLVRVEGRLWDHSGNPDGLDSSTGAVGRGATPRRLIAAGAAGSLDPDPRRANLSRVTREGIKPRKGGSSAGKRRVRGGRALPPSGQRVSCSGR